MAPAQSSYNYSQLVIKFMTARHQMMSSYTQQVIEHLYHLAKLLNSIDNLSGRSLFVIDDFLVDLTVELPADT